MAWDDKDKKDNDPWNRGRRSDTPPDLDEVLKKLQDKLSGFFGGKGSSKSEKPPTGIAVASVGLIVLVFCALWFVAGIFIVGPAEEGVITRFGKYRTTVGPGLNWIPRFIDKTYIVDIQNVSDFSYSSMMLTQDENIVSVELAVQYRVGIANDFLFNVDNPVESLQQATASALRHVIGHTSLSDILTTGREDVRQKVKVQLGVILDRYKTGLTLMDVVMQPATPPEEVKEAFDDAIKAQEDEQRFKNQAMAYEREVVPKAHGQAKRLLESAKAYKEKTVLWSKGEVAKFKAILPEYKKAPRVTKERMYLDTMEYVLSNSSKILLDTKGGGNLTYLPIDKILANNDVVESNADSRDRKSMLSSLRQSPNKGDYVSRKKDDSYNSRRVH